MAVHYYPFASYTVTAATSGVSILTGLPALPSQFTNSKRLYLEFTVKNTGASTTVYVAAPGEDALTAKEITAGSVAVLGPYINDTAVAPELYVSAGTQACTVTPSVVRHLQHGSV